jgi:isopentenyl diphosphate isomerase/L-lactate dehydrogenase-like FMN-dependent dehydrogenase
MSALDRCFNTWDLREAARRRLPRGVFEFVDRGVEDEQSLAGNVAAFRRLKLWNRVLIDLDGADLGTELLGARAGMPLAISPTGLAGLCWHEGEVALAKAAAAANIPYALANGSITAMEKIASRAGGRLWFQIYIWRARELTYEVVRRAQDCGFEALIVTADTGLGGNREHNRRNDFGVPFRFTHRNVADFICHPRYLAKVILPYLRESGLPRHGNYPAGYESLVAGHGKAKSKDMRGENAAWDDIDKLRALWPGKLIVKGIAHPDDAQEAVRRGADAIIVSNHGGRALDSAPAALDALPLIAEAVGKRTTIILDSGVRRGGDIVKALALGADAVMMGRASLYGVAAGGEAGAARAIALLRAEYRQTMGYVGARHVGEIGPHMIFAPDRGNRPGETKESR